MGPEMHARVIGIMIGVLVGAVVAMLIGFKGAGWTTANAAQAKVDAAILETQSAICAAQYLGNANNGQKLKEFALVGANDRSDFIEKGGWDRMPGQEKATWGVARACVTGLEGMIKQ